MLTLDANIWVAVYDPQDNFHAQSITFLYEAVQRRFVLNGPAIVIIEASCVLARRTQNTVLGQAAFDHLRVHPLLTLQPVDDVLLMAAARIGVQRLLRAADALYVATAEVNRSTLVTWDKELIGRAGALTPADWLAANP
jgi:predicted nucleic acid-binding protein